MRIIPKKIKVKNTVWKCYSMADVIVALIVFAIIFIAITSGAFAFAVIMGLLAVVMFMPTQDGIFYSCILENIKFLFAKKVYTENADKQKERVDALLNLKDIKENGLIEYSGGYFGRVIKVGQKNFGIEDVVQQNIDIDYFANALKNARRHAMRRHYKNRPSRKLGQLRARPVRQACGNERKRRRGTSQRDKNGYFA